MSADILQTDRLAALMRRERVNQTELAQAAGVSQGFISNLLRGEKQPGRETLSRIATRLKTTIDYLLNAERPNGLPTPGDSRRRDARHQAFGALVARRKLATLTEIGIYTSWALTRDEILGLQAGASPADIDEDRMVAFLNRFDSDDIRAYYQAAGMMLPQAFRDLEVEFRELLSRVHNYSEADSPEAKRWILELIRQEFGE